MAQASFNTTQLRRDAKRLAREHDLTHSQALDRLARDRGYPNWSQLVKNSAAPAPADVHTSPRMTRAAMRQLVGLPGVDVTPVEQRTIMAIVKRYGDFVGNDIEFNALSLMLDLQACHSNGCPLDLDELLHAARDADFVHDVAGISQNMNRETAKLEGGFTPRYAKMSTPTLPPAE